MITEDRLNKLWKRTIWHWLFACLVTMGIVLYQLFNNEDGKGLTPLSALGIIGIIVAATLLFFFVTRAIKKVIGARFGQRENRK